MALFGEMVNFRPEHEICKIDLNHQIISESYKVKKDY